MAVFYERSLVLIDKSTLLNSLNRKLMHKAIKKLTEGVVKLTQARKKKSYFSHAYTLKKQRLKITQLEKVLFINSS